MASTSFDLVFNGTGQATHHVAPAPHHVPSYLNLTIDDGEYVSMAWLVDVTSAGQPKKSGSCAARVVVGGSADRPPDHHISCGLEGEVGVTTRTGPSGETTKARPGVSENVLRRLWPTTYPIALEHVRKETQNLAATFGHADLKVTAASAHWQNSRDEDGKFLLHERIRSSSSVNSTLYIEAANVDASKRILCKVSFVDSRLLRSSCVFEGKRFTFEAAPTEG